MFHLVVKQISVQKGEDCLSQYCFWKAVYSYANTFFNLGSFSAVRSLQAAVPQFFLSICTVAASSPYPAACSLCFISFLCPLASRGVAAVIQPHIMNLPGKLILLKNNTFWPPPPAQSGLFFHLGRFLDLLSCRAVQAALPRTSRLDSGQRLLRLTKAAFLPKVKWQIPLQQ